MRTVQAYTQERGPSGASPRWWRMPSGPPASATLSRALLTAFAIFLVFASVVAVLWLGRRSVLSGEMSAGTLGQFLLYSVFAAGALAELSQVWGEVTQAAGATERIAEILATKPKIAAPDMPLALPEPARGEIAFDDVHFNYEGRACRCCAASRST